jgi:hypothetical protein
MVWSITNLIAVLGPRLILADIHAKFTNWYKTIVKMTLTQIKGLN